MRVVLFCFGSLVLFFSKAVDEPFGFDFLPYIVDRVIVSDPVKPALKRAL